jgi:NAD(P)H-dependent FMN reductase
MPSPVDVAVIVGSFRKGSYSRKIARAIIQLAPQSLRCREVEIRQLEMYNEDLDRTPPASWKRFIPACLKNALDVRSRPQAGIVSVTPYQMGAMAANHAVRQVLVFLNMPAGRPANSWRTSWSPSNVGSPA